MNIPHDTVLLIDYFQIGIIKNNAAEISSYMPFCIHMYAVLLHLYSGRIAGHRKHLCLAPIETTKVVILLYTPTSCV